VALDCFPPTKFFSKATIKSIQIQGYDIEQIHEALKYVDSVESYKAKNISECQSYIHQADEAAENLKILTDSIDKQEKEIFQRKSEISKLEEEIDILSSNLELATSKLSKTERQIAERRSDIGLLDGEIEKRTSSRKILSDEISSKEIELRNLENDINLFPSEISGYVTQGAKTLKHTSFYHLFLLLLLPVLTWRLIETQNK
jgi:chromosome segregation ATPase